MFVLNNYNDMTIITITMYVYLFFFSSISNIMTITTADDDVVIDTFIFLL